MPYPKLVGTPCISMQWCVLQMMLGFNDIWEGNYEKTWEKRRKQNRCVNGNKQCIWVQTFREVFFKMCIKWCINISLILIKYWWHKKLCYVPDGPKCTGIHPIHVPMYPPEFDNACGRHSKWFTQQHNTTSQCLKIIQNVAFEFLYFGIFRKVQFPEIRVRFPLTMTLLRVLQKPIV